MSTSDMEIDTKALSIDEKIKQSELDEAQTKIEKENEKDEDMMKHPPNPTDKCPEDDSDYDMDGDENDKESNETESIDSNSSSTKVLERALRLKEEGNAFFKEQKLSEAARTYRKASTSLKRISKGDSLDPQISSLALSLHNNHSMVNFKLKKWKLSKDMATLALKIDRNNVKALYRRAMAARELNDLDVAKTDLKKALKIDPENREIRKGWMALKKDYEKVEKIEVRRKEKLKKALSQGNSLLYEDKEEELKKKALKKKKIKEENERMEKEDKEKWENECVQKLANNEPAITYDEWKKEKKAKEEEEQKKKKKEEELVRKKREEERRKRREQAKTEESSSSEDDDCKKIIRGYKKTSDGRTTSYFTREMSEHEKKLIGNITPQRLDQSNTAPRKITSTSSSNKSESAWNTARTWEERDTTEWCSKKLELRLSETTAMEEPYTATISKVDSVTGHASFVLANGKKRYVFDYNAELKFKVNDHSDEEVASGKVSLIDICSSTVNSGEYDIRWFWDKTPKGLHSDQISSLCKEKMIVAIRDSVLNFVNDFNSNY